MSGPESRGGWVLNLTCGGCGTVTVVRHYVPSLVLDTVEQSGWRTSPKPMTRPTEHRSGTCPRC